MIKIGKTKYILGKFRERHVNKRYSMPFRILTPTARQKKTTT